MAKMKSTTALCELVWPMWGENEETSAHKMYLRNGGSFFVSFLQIYLELPLETYLLFMLIVELVAREVIIVNDLPFGRVIYDSE